MQSANSVQGMVLMSEPDTAVQLDAAEARE
jgi:hypothetical protein